MKNAWAKINAFIQLEDSLLVGGIAGLPVVIALVLFVFIDGFLLKLWGGIFGISGTEKYFFLPGSAFALTLLIFYFGGRIGKTEWFLKSLGRIVAKIPFLGSGYKKAILIMYTRKGFLKPVWVYRSGLLRFDREGPKGKVVETLRGTARRGYFLREVLDRNPNLPEALRLTCEVLVPPSQMVGGEPERFPFQLTFIQLDPGMGAFTAATFTQGLDGYTEMESLEWTFARKKLEFETLPEKDRKLLLGLGIIVPKQVGQAVNSE